MYVLYTCGLYACMGDVRATYVRHHLIGDPMGWQPRSAAIEFYTKREMIVWHFAGCSDADGVGNLAPPPQGFTLRESRLQRRRSSGSDNPGIRFALSRLNHLMNG